MKLKQTLIHFLGGMTAEDVRENNAETSMNAFLCGQRITLRDAKNKADTLYGEPADVWCKEMYHYLATRISELENNHSTMSKSDQQ